MHSWYRSRGEDWMVVKAHLAYGHKEELMGT
jgi:hypothetical protein